MKDAHISRVRAAAEEKEYEPTFRQQHLRMGGHRRMDHNGKLQASHTLAGGFKGFL